MPHWCHWACSGLVPWTLCECKRGGHIAGNMWLTGHSTAISIQDDRDDDNEDDDDEYTDDNDEHEHENEYYDDGRHRWHRRQRR